jgi:hypothetical protein
MPAEVVTVWSLFLGTAVVVLVTYARLPASELYNVSGTGLSGGGSRALVYLDFPTALGAIGILAIAFDRLASRVWRALAVTAAVLCAAVFWPGIVEQSNLDARPVNAICAVGVALALAVSTQGSGWMRSRQGDRLRLGIGVFVLVLSPEWIAAEFGFFLNRVPLLSHVYLTGRYRPEQPGLPPFAPAVHHGDHHGFNGVLLVTTALVLSRLLPSISTRGLRGATAFYLALMLAYGAGNIANDFWLEQVVKRDWTAWLVPSVLEPHVGWGWLFVLVGAIVVWLAWFGREEGLA